MRHYPAVALLCFTACTAAAADLAQESAQHGDIDVAVTLDAAEQSGSAKAMVRIHARRDVVWSLITSCAEALRHMLRWIGPMGTPVVWFDYTTTPPTLKIATRDQLPGATLPLTP